jgi:glycosyltransferase involved in cell wall biosynthesis
MKISVVIPVYNEADQLESCLEAIAAQVVKPYEVIVVDNNSTDKTLLVASNYSFVRVLSETKQGVVHARTTGFNAARGDIIARIDADSILPSDWTNVIAEVFEDQSIDAVSGAAYYYNVAAAPLFNGVDLFFRKRLSHKLKNRVYLWGANMAIRVKAWQMVKPYLCQRGGIHEDYDLAIHLQEQGGKVIFDERLKAEVSSRRIDSGYFDFMRYVLASPHTYAEHKIGLRRHMYPLVLTLAVGYLPMRIMHRGYDVETEHFSLSHLFYPKVINVRVDPTINVI